MNDDKEHQANDNKSEQTFKAIMNIYIVPIPIKVVRSSQSAVRTGHNERMCKNKIKGNRMTDGWT